MVHLEYNSLNKLYINESVIVLTAPNGQGWRITKGTSVCFDFIGNELGSDNESVRPGFIINDNFHFSSLHSPKETIYEFSAPTTGIYYLFIVSENFPV